MEALLLQMAATLLKDIMEELCEDEEHAIGRQNASVRLSGAHTHRQSQASGSGRCQRNSVKTAKAFLTNLPERHGALMHFLPNIDCCAETLGDDSMADSEGERNDEDDPIALTRGRAVLNMVKDWKDVLRHAVIEV
jgi:hypothetical protein